jgi:hypothetical protein
MMNPAVMHGAIFSAIVDLVDGLEDELRRQAAFLDEYPWDSLAIGRYRALHQELALYYPRGQRAAPAWLTFQVAEA